MNRKVLGALFGLGFTVAACATGSDSTSGSSSDLSSSAGNPDQTADTSSDVQTKSVCAGGRFECFAKIQVGANGQPLHFAAPSGLGATDLQDAYKLDPTLDPGATIAIVDAFGYAKAEADLNVYRAQYGLGKCTIDSGCLTIVNQDGNASPLPPEPPSNDDWTTETALDLDMASAACPKCKLLLVQANSDQDEGLFLAQATAARLGATVISDSWGGAETTDDPSLQYEHYFDLPNVGIFVAAGDHGLQQRRQGPGLPVDLRARHRRRRHEPEEVDQRHAWLDREGLGRAAVEPLRRGRQLLRADDSEAVVPGQHILQLPRGLGRRRGRRPAHGPVGLPQRLDRGRWHLGRLAARRRHLCAHRPRQGSAELLVHAQGRVLGRHERIERQVRQRSLQRRLWLGRPDRQRHAERRGSQGNSLTVRG